eukprot:TRINITY_DN15571_c0_g1_i1.p1 TRINITY_DN15571_c0_g1~~TRINITY_DN15571_c0_g1_i1.p1  ORF type:complete len:382 (-),score=63.54 TRINITY_DN15571_c0_g1_i1:135-1259(-)
MADKVHIIPIEARELAIGDSVTRRADPYCVVKYGNTAKHTRVISRTLHPVWSWSLFTFDYDPSVKEIVFEVWDKDSLKKDDFLGSYTLQLKTTESYEADEWVVLTGSKVSEKVEGKTEAKGHVHYRLWYQKPLPEFHPDPLGNSFHFFKDHKQKMNTGDCILFSGSETISGIIKQFMHTPYSHCGMILRMPDRDGKEEVFVCEADWDTGDYYDEKEEIYGITINLYDKRMESYVGDVIWHCPLKEPLNEEQSKKVIDFILERKKSKCKYDMFQGIKMMACLKNKPCSNAVFCSELVAFAMSIAGTIAPTVNCSEQDPYEVSKLPCYDHGQFPRTMLRYQVEVDAAKMSSTSISEFTDLLPKNPFSKKKKEKTDA